MNDMFDLGKIAAILEGLEETIIFKLIDRAQFKRNMPAYTAGKSGFPNAEKESLFSLRLRYQERMDAQFGRFSVPEERPFLSHLPISKRSLSLPQTGLQYKNVNDINLGTRICSAYFDLLPRICQSGNDGHYGSSVEHDVYALQAIARRIHYGALYVAESKFRGDPVAYTALIEKKDTRGLLKLLTRKAVEDAILVRIREKVAHAQTRVNSAVRHVIDTASLLRFYRDQVIPLTKEGEIAYLLNRPRSQNATKPKGQA